LRQADAPEGIDQRKVRADLADLLPTLLDLDFFDVAQVTVKGHAKVFDLGRIDTHNTAAGGVHSRQVGAHHQHTDGLGSALNRTITFHAHDAVHDGKAAAENAVQLDDRFGNSDMVQLILRPAVN